MVFWRPYFSHEEGSARDLKIRAILTKTQDKCKLFYSPSSRVSVDESIISFKGKIKFKIYNPNTPSKFCLKLFVLSTSLIGYTYNFDLYYEKLENE